MTVIDDFVAEALRLQSILGLLTQAQWQADSGADGWSVADVVLHLQWVAGPMKPATLTTTRLAEYWAHGLDITDPLGIDFPDTDRLRHIAWLAHRTLPYALSRAGEGPAAVRCSLTAPDQMTRWRFGPDDADSEITGPAGAFCRVAAQRLDPADSGLRAAGPHGAAALRVVRTYA